MFSLLLCLIISSPPPLVAATARTEHNATAVATVGWVSDSDNTRSTIGLLYSCLSTIFLCTWTAMHLNIPGESDSSLRIFWRRCKWMLFGLLAPELVAVAAITQWQNARQFVRIEPHVPTISHGFFAMMGGYAIELRQSAKDDAPPRRIRLKPKDFLKFIKIQSPELPVKSELMDKSKGDWISKSVTSIQVIWFICQLVGRAVCQLPSTTLELFTCAIVVCTAATYLAWWNKPLDVQRPIVLNSEVPAAFLADHQIDGLKSYYSFLNDGEMPAGFWTHVSQQTPPLVLISLAFAACHLIGWNFYFPTWTEQLLWRVASVLCAGIPILLIPLTWLEERGIKRKKLVLVTTLYCGAYILVRAYLLAEVFTGLRSVPVGVYTAVNWSAYIPHI